MEWFFIIRGLRVLEVQDDGGVVNGPVHRWSFIE